MDDNLREMGIGDMSVPKHMKRVGEAFYGRAQAYQAALAAADDKALIEALTRNIYGGAAPSAAVVSRLATYIRGVAGALGAPAGGHADRRPCRPAGPGRRYSGG